jgi:hypothetical protein
MFFTEWLISCPLWFQWLFTILLLVYFLVSLIRIFKLWSIQRGM